MRVIKWLVILTALLIIIVLGVGTLVSVSTNPTITIQNNSDVLMEKILAVKTYGLGKIHEQSLGDLPSNTSEEYQLDEKPEGILDIHFSQNGQSLKVSCDFYGPLLESFLLVVSKSINGLHCRYYSKSE